jgi:hypothetical protein
MYLCDDNDDADDDNDDDDDDDDNDDDWGEVVVVDEIATLLLTVLTLYLPSTQAVLDGPGIPKKPGRQFPHVLAGNLQGKRLRLPQSTEEVTEQS